MMGQPISTRVEFCIAELLIFKHYCRSTRRALDLLFKQFMYALRGIFSPCIVPLVKHLMLLGLIEKRQFGQPFLRRSSRLPQNKLPMFEHALDSRGIEQIGVVSEPPFYPPFPIHKNETDVELDRSIFTSN